GVDDVVSRRQVFGTVYELHVGATVRELERVEHRAVTATDHRNRAAGEVLRPRFEQVGHVAAEGAVNRGGPGLVSCTGREDERATAHPRVVGFDPTLRDVHPDDTL